jgi:hypothetical protein
MVDHLGEVVFEALGATVEVLADAEPRRRRWRIARVIALVLIFSLIIGVPIAILLSLG